MLQMHWYHRDMPELNESGIAAAPAKRIPQV
jgi:hypothetical protein